MSQCIYFMLMVSHVIVDVDRHVNVPFTSVLNAS